MFTGKADGYNGSLSVNHFEICFLGQNIEEGVECFACHE